MTTELWALLGITGFLVSFLAALFWFSLSTIRASHLETVESLRQDKKALHTLLKEAQNRIHAASLNDYLMLQAHNGGTEVHEGPPPHQSLSRSDAVEAEIASRMSGTQIGMGGE